MKRFFWMYFAPAVAGYYLISMAAYSYSHPEKTQIQLLFDIGKAMTWNWDD